MSGAACLCRRRRQNPTLPAAPVLDILISPGYPADPTVFVLLESGRVYRTEDDGLTWTRNQGGLPRHDNLTLSLSLSLISLRIARSLPAASWVITKERASSAPQMQEIPGSLCGKGWSICVYDLRVSPEFATDGRIHAFRAISASRRGKQALACGSLRIAGCRGRRS